MHRSRLAGFIIDCQHTDPARAAEFWGPALGFDVRGAEGNYVHLDASARDLAVEIQSVDHESRVHLDIETDDIEAEVARLERLGARRIADVRTWVVMEAPTGQRFCVIRARHDLAGRPGTRTWD